MSIRKYFNLTEILFETSFILIALSVFAVLYFPAVRSINKENNLSLVYNMETALATSAELIAQKASIMPQESKSKEGRVCVQNSTLGNCPETHIIALTYGQPAVSDDGIIKALQQGITAYLIEPADWISVLDEEGIPLTDDDTTETVPTRMFYHRDFYPLQKARNQYTGCGIIYQAPTGVNKPIFIKKITDRC